MRTLPTRQVHLDFHTSPLIPGVGGKFDKLQFQAALREGNVNSVTVFAKGHHGMCYFPTKVGTPHPTMKPGFDLTGAMVDAAHEIGVDAPIYITAGWSALDAEAHPDWLMCDRDGKPIETHIDPEAAPGDPRPFNSWQNLCLSGDYAQHIYDLTREICDRYPVVDGLFFDIVYLEEACFCPNCLSGMRAEGLDPEKPEDAREYYRRSHLRFMENCTEILHEKHPEATVFFNSGGADIYRPEYHAGQTHFEMEDLPTAWGGYDKMPPRASVMSRYGKEYLGMTGKFHTEWGEFGGYKNPDALKYEALLMGMYGARCSVGDQMLPNGLMDMETYRCIGRAYRAYEAMEPWFFPAVSAAKAGVYLSGCGDSDEGLHRMLLEGHIDFEVVLPGDDLSRFDVLILPDSVAITAEEAERIRGFAENGGAVLFSAESLIRDGEFLIDAGVTCPEPAACRSDYLCVEDTLRLPYGNAPFYCYESAMRTTLCGGETLAAVFEPWFDRTYGAYCSHRNTPYRDTPAEHPAVVRRGSVIYFAHPLFRLYRRYGLQLFREVFLKALKLVFTPCYTVDLPSAGRTRLTCQPEAHRYVFNIAYASPIQRGNTTVLDDMPVLSEIPVELRLSGKVTGVRLVPSGEALPFTAADGSVRFMIPRLRCHAAVEIAAE